MKPLLAALAAILLAGPALADVAPEPGEQEAQLARLVRRAGHPCADPTVFEALTEADRAAGRKRNLGVRRMRCGDGPLYLVSVPPRRRPSSPPAPPPFVHRLDVP